MCGCAPSNGTISLLTRYELASVPPVIRCPCHLAWAGLRPVSGDVVFSKLSKLLNQEDALSAPCLKHFHNYWWPIKLATCGFPGEKTSYFETIVVPNICRKLISHLGKELLYRVDLANKCNRFPERAKIVAYQVTVRGHFREMSSPVSRIFY